jgi:enamine deaminase RidA (YjgF/YER057c/UK114 family)
MSRAPRHAIASGAPWEALIGYSRAVRVGGYIAVSGTTAVDSAGRPVAPGDAYAQTMYALGIVQTALEALGADLGDVVRTRLFVTDIALWPEIGRAHGEFFGSIRPAATMVQVAALIDPALLVEIEADAVVA